MSKTTLSRFTMNDIDKAMCFEHVREVHAQFDGNYAQSKNAVACRRAILDKMGDNGWPEPGTTEHVEMLAILYFFSNSSAVRQAVLENKSTGTQAVADYADIV